MNCKSLMRCSVVVVCVSNAARGAPPAADPAVVWQSLVLGGIKAASVRNFPSAEELLSKAVKVAETFPPGDPRTGTTLNTLGLAYKEEKKYGDAEKAFESALKILEKAYGPDSLDVGNVNFNIASVLMSGGHYDTALPYIQKSRSVYQKVLGPDSLKMASTLCMAGITYRNLGQYGEAEAPLKQCADAREMSGGLENAETGEALYNLGLVYLHQGRYPAADATLKLAEKIRELTLGVTSPEFAESLEARAAVLKLMGRNSESTRNEALAAAIRRNEKKTP